MYILFQINYSKLHVLATDRMTQALKL